MFKKLSNKFKRDNKLAMPTREGIKETDDYSLLTERQLKKVQNLFSDFIDEYVGKGNDKKPVDKEKIFIEFAIQNESRLNSIKADLADDFYQNKFAYIIGAKYVLKWHNHFLQKNYTQESDSSYLVRVHKRLSLSELIEWGTKEAKFKYFLGYWTKDTTNGVDGYVSFDENRNVHTSGNIKDDAVFNISVLKSIDELEFDKVMAVSYSSDFAMDGEGTCANIHSNVTLDELIDVYSGLLREVYHIQDDGELTLLWHNSGLKPLLNIAPYTHKAETETLLNTKTDTLETHTKEYWELCASLKERKAGNPEYYLSASAKKQLWKKYGYEKIE